MVPRAQPVAGEFLDMIQLGIRPFAIVVIKDEVSNAIRREFACVRHGAVPPAALALQFFFHVLRIMDQHIRR